METAPARERSEDRARSSENPYVFLVGCPRSGTTLLQRMVDAHPMLAALNETLWISQFYKKRRGLTAEGLVTRELTPHLLAHRRFERMGVSPEDLYRMLEAEPGMPYSHFVGRLFDLYAKRQGKPLVADKSPGYVRSIPTLHELWPQARFVHLIRDGRDVCLSFLNWKKADRIAGKYATWSEDRLATVALWWERNVRLGREAGEALESGLYSELRYENLVARPAEECADLCAFLGVPYDHAMTTFHEGRTRSEPGLTTKSAWLPPTAGLRDWHTQMPPEDVERFEAVAGELLEELGYPRAFPTPGEQASEQAGEVRRRFTESVERGKSRPPTRRGAPVTEGKSKETPDDKDEAPAKNPYLFVVGCPRSGTTLLRRMLDAHPAIAMTPNETHWIPKWFEQRIGLTQEGMVTPELITSLLEYPRFVKLGLERSVLESLASSEEPLPYARFVTAVFDLYGASRSSRLVGDKTPGYTRSIPILHELWPSARFVHLIRDGRSVCLSALSWRRAPQLADRFPTWKREPVLTAALWWEQHVRLAREAGAALDGSLYHELRYEALVADQEQECAALCAFLDLPYDDSMVRFAEGRTRAAPGLSAKHAWLPATPGLRNWREDMPAEELELFEAAAGELLDELGYPHAAARPSSEAIDRASSVREQFVQKLRRGGRPLPLAWEAA